LKLDHQLNQLVLAQALQISPFHEHMDSEIALRGKGVGKYPERRVRGGGAGQTASSAKIFLTDADGCLHSVEEAN
jgi:hypothetical protein